MIAVSPLVHVVDDDASFRTSISRLLRAVGYRVAVYESARQLLDRLPDQADPSCILLDVKIPDMSGPELQHRLGELGSTLPIIFLTGYGDIPTSVQVIKKGAEDFLVKPVSKDTLVSAVERAVIRHKKAIDQRSDLNVLRALAATLTPREQQVFNLVARGKMNKQIAQMLGTTVRTIKAHRHKVMAKTNAQSLAELVLIADRLGMVTPDHIE